MYCVKCGQEIPDKSKFCSHCGLPVHSAIRDMMANENKEISDTQDSATSEAVKIVAARPVQHLESAELVGDQDTTSSALIQQRQLENVETEVEQPATRLDSNDDEVVEQEHIVEESQQSSSSSRGRIGLIIAIIGQILIVAILVFDYMKLPFKAAWTIETAETALTIYLAVILGVDVLTYIFCGGKRVIRWILKAFKIGWRFLPLRGINFAGLVFALMLDLALAVTFGFIMMVFCVFVPVVPAFLTYRENK